MTEFYLTISNTDSSSYFPENTPSNFYAKLPYLMKLEGDWLVGVSQIWLPKMWYNVSEMDILLATNEEMHDVNLKSGYYNDAEELIVELNKCVTINGVSKAKFSYDNVNHKIKVNVEKGYNLALPYELSKLLGAERENFQGEIIFKKSPDIHKYDNNVTVHIDIVEGLLSGCGVTNTVKLLNTSNAEFGDVVYDGYITSYSRVSTDRFDVVRVSAKNRMGDFIKQEGGDTVIQLHFKRE